MSYLPPKSYNKMKYFHQDIGCILWKTQTKTMIYWNILPHVHISSNNIKRNSFLKDLLKYMKSARMKLRTKIVRKKNNKDRHKNRIYEDHYSFCETYHTGKSRCISVVIREHIYKAKMDCNW